MSDDYAALAGALQGRGSGHIMLLSPKKSTNDFLLVTVPDEQAAAFVARLSNPLAVDYTDGDDNGNAWQAQRTETVTEAALALLDVEFQALIDDLHKAAAGASESLGELYLDGNAIVIVLVDAERRVFQELTAIRRTSAEGIDYPIFEKRELRMTQGTYQVYITASGSWW